MKSLQDSTIFRKRLGLLLCWAGLLCFSIAAQTGTAVIRGTVTDPQGKAVPGAAIKIVSVERSFNRTQIANNDGAYVFSAVPPGQYRVEVEASGFKKTALTDVIAQVDTPRDLDVSLEVGNVTEPPISAPPPKPRSIRRTPASAITLNRAASRICRSTPATSSACFRSNQA